jgi:bifunctional enzyme CysN/CysC
MATPVSTVAHTERLRLVIVGHVDHGKSTVIGRLLADTGSLPEGKLEQVKRTCERNAKPFEYAFLLDALHDEQDQGITIDSARCFFRTARRYYLVIDAPGHIEFLKNMVTGAANAEAALIVIDAQEGIRENTRRHGYLISMLGIRQVVVIVNKMDLVGYRQAVYERLKTEYGQFLSHLNIEQPDFIPISARQGENMVHRSDRMPWYTGLSVIEQLDALEKEPADRRLTLPLRFPLQDIYKFTEAGDDRRILAGTIETGSVATGDEVLFLPSGKSARITGIEQFSASAQHEAYAGQALGFTIEPQIYLKPGELMVKRGELQPHVGTRFRANIFWMGRAPLIRDKQYKLKIATKRVGVRLVQVLNVIDASDLETVHNKQQVDRHDVGECILETVRPIAFDLAADLDHTGRFVLVDQYEIAGGGIILEGLSDQETLLAEHIRDRERSWDRGNITPENRAAAYRHRSLCVILTGEGPAWKRELARRIEQRLFQDRYHVYYLSFTNLDLGLDADIRASGEDRTEQIRRLGELARIVTDAGQVFVTVLDGVDDYDLEQLKQLIAPYEALVINIGDNLFQRFPVDLNLASEEMDGLLEQAVRLIRGRI